MPSRQGKDEKVPISPIELAKALYYLARGATISIDDIIDAYNELVKNDDSSNNTVPQQA